MNQGNYDIMLEWYNHFKNSGEIPIPDNTYELEWIGDNYELIDDWIKNEYNYDNGDPSDTSEIHMKALLDILLLIDKNLYDEYLNKIQIQKCMKVDNFITNFKEYAKKYREENRMKITEKRANYYIKNRDNILSQKIVDNLNKGITNKPRPKTIQKYNLHYDGEKWLINNKMRIGI
jgi:hypothetical protein